MRNIALATIDDLFCSVCHDPMSIIDGDPTTPGDIVVTPREGNHADGPAHVECVLGDLARWDIRRVAR